MSIQSARTQLSPTTESLRRRALVLDLDGVLVNTRPVMQEAWRKVRETHGIDVPFDAYEQHLGRPFQDIMDRLGLADSANVHKTYAAASHAASCLAKPFDGIEDVLHAFAAADWLLAVVTSKPLDRAIPLLARLGCPFATVRAPRGVERCKPAPDPLLLALIDMGTDPASATYVGAMAVDQECARRAGVPYIHAGWGYGLLDSPPRVIADTPRDLLCLLDPSSGSASFVEGGLL